MYFLGLVLKNVSNKEKKKYAFFYGADSRASKG